MKRALPQRRNADRADRARERHIRSLCRRMLRKVSTQRPSAIETRCDIDRVVADHGLELAMPGIGALCLRQATPPRANTNSPFDTPSSPRKTRTRKQSPPQQQRIFAETPLRDYADVQRSAQNTRTAKSHNRVRGASSPSMDSSTTTVSTRTKNVRAPRTPSEDNMGSLFGISAVWDHANSPT